MNRKATCHRALTTTAFHRCNRDDLPHGSPAPYERLANRLQTMLTDFCPLCFGELLSEHRRPLSRTGKGSFSAQILDLGRSAAAAGRRYNGLEHIKRLNAHLTVGLAIDGNVQDVS